MKYSKTYEVNGFDLDPNYRLKKHLLAAYFQNTMACELDELGLAAFHLQEEDKTWILNEMRVDYSSKMPRWREEVRIDTWTRKLSSIRLYRDYEAYGVSGRLIARGTTSVLIVNDRTRRPEKLGPTADRFSVIDEEVFPGYRFPKLDPPGHDATYRLTGTVRTFDIDFNNHLNNIRYIAAAIEPIPYHYRREKTLKTFSIKYTNEAYLHDELVAECTGKGDDFHHRIFRRADGATLCTMSSSWV
jgi:medium-chain acyl-[acyl-carrier-protein] hydrolase